MIDFKTVEDSRFVLLNETDRLHQLQVFYRKLHYWIMDEEHLFENWFGESKKKIRLKALRDKVDAHIDWYVKKAIPEMAHYGTYSIGSDRPINVRTGNKQKFVLLYLVDTSAKVEDNDSCSNK